MKPIATVQCRSENDNNSEAFIRTGVNNYTIIKKHNASRIQGVFNFITKEGVFTYLIFNSAISTQFDTWACEST